MNPILLKEKIKAYLMEDLAQGDLASQIFPPKEESTMEFVVKSPGIFCGGAVIEQGFNLLDEAKVELLAEEGAWVEPGAVLCKIHGKTRNLLSSERTVLNLVQRMSGIATYTHQLVDLLKGSSTRLCDTRKTTPGLAMMEKYAVRCGGGKNHRRNLNDGLMLKDNHIAAMGSMKEAVRQGRLLNGPMDKLEVEITNKEELLQAIEANADIIMFDNMTPEKIKELLPLVPKNILTEASGGITEETIAAYGQTGVDYISVGALFYGGKAMDISARLKAEKRP